MSLFDINKAKKLGAGAESLFAAKAGKTLKNAWKKGFNKWDEEWELGLIDNTGASVPYSGALRSKNYIPVVPGATYYVKAPRTLYPFGYDQDKKYVKQIPSASGISNNKLNIPDDICYMRFVAYTTTYNSDICINISGEHDGEYVPYNG